MYSNKALFEKPIKEIKLFIKELQNSEQNLEQKILLIAEKLREKNLKHLAKKDISGDEQTASKESKKALSPLMYLVLLKKTNTLAFRINYIGDTKEDLIPAIEE